MESKILYNQLINSNSGKRYMKCKKQHLINILIHRAKIINQNQKNIFQNSLKKKNKYQLLISILGF